MFFNKLLLKIKSKIKIFKDEKKLEEKEFKSNEDYSNSFVKTNPVEDLDEKTVELNEAEQRFVDKGVEAQMNFVDKQLETNLIQKSNEAGQKAHLNFLKESTARNLNQK